MYICHEVDTSKTWLMGIAAPYAGQDTSTPPADEGMTPGAVAGTVISVLALTGAGAFFAVKRGALGALTSGYSLVNSTGGTAISNAWNSIKSFTSRGTSAPASSLSSSSSSSGSYGAV